MGKFYVELSGSWRFYCYTRAASMVEAIEEAVEEMNDSSDSLDIDLERVEAEEDTREGI